MGMISPVSLTRLLWALWWLILCVTLIGLRGAQIPDETLFMSVSVSVLPEEINIWMGRLSKEDSPWTRGIIQSMETLNRTKGRGRRNSLFFPGLMLELGHFIFSSPWTGIYTIHSPGSQAFGLRLNYTTGFPGSPACRWQIVGLLSFHNHVSQFPQINISIATSWCFCFSGEHWLTQIYFKRYTVL